MTQELQMASELIRHYESCNLSPYEDAIGIATIGWGNTQYTDGTKVALDDDDLTQSEADALFDFWLNDFAARVMRLVPGGNDYQLAAFISLAYNIGIGSFSKSTALRMYLNADLPRAANGIEMWNRAGNHVLKGLQRRRYAERCVFEGAAVQVAIAAALAKFA